MSGRFRMRMIAFPLRLGAIIVVCGSAAPAGEPDIMDLAKRNPLQISVDGKPARFGDPQLAQAVDALVDLPHPWTVPGIIKLFEQESDLWIRKLKQRRDEHNPHLWEGSREESKRCGHLATLLASSRDSRSAVALCRTIDQETTFIDGIRVFEGVYHYFARDERYKQVAPEHTGTFFTMNFYPEMIRHVKKWWALNKSDLEATAAEASPEEDK